MSRIIGIVCWMLTIPVVAGGCSSWSSFPPTSQPYFSVEPSDAKTLHALSKKLDGLAAKCAEYSSCDHAYFARALIGLYESRDTATKYFEKVIAVAPRGQLAASSKLWLQLLRQDPAPGQQSWFEAVMTAPAVSESHETLGRTTDRLVRDLLDREMMIQQLRTTRQVEAQTIESLQRELAERDRKVDALMGKMEQSRPSVDPATVQSLQKQLLERDKKIDELSGQLEALKRIDQEMRDKVRPIRPPSTIVVPGGPEPSKPQ